ncbi:MAG: hypothetical protein IH897_10690 [Planctomycetes bacterium]|nr:hypothetical protein [Planctomycetota bacterium]
MWILVAAVVAFAALRRGRQGQENSTGSRWSHRSIMVACLFFAFLFLFLGNRGPFRNRDSRAPNLLTIQFPEMPRMPNLAGEVHVPRDFLARQQYEMAKHRHGASHSARTSSDKVFSEQTIVTNQDGTVIAISQTSEGRAPRTYRGTVAGIVGFAVAGLIVVAFLYIGYLFLDAGTRGQFSWTLRIASIVAFGVICAVVALLRQRM